MSVNEINYLGFKATDKIKFFDKIIERILVYISPEYHPSIVYPNPTYFDLNFKNKL